MGPALPFVMMGTTAASAGLGAYGSIFQGDAQANAYKYNAAVARENAEAAKQNAQMAGESGAAQAAMVSMRNRQTYGSTKAQQAASGVDVNSGSAVDVRASERELGNLDAYNSRVQAVRQAYGYQVQEAQFQGEAALDEYQADASQEAGYLGAAGSLLGGAGQMGQEYTNWQMVSGGFG